MPSDATLTAQNCCFGFLSADKPFEIVEDEVRIQSYLDQLPPAAPTSASEEQTAADAGAAVEAQEPPATDDNNQMDDI